MPFTADELSNIANSALKNYLDRGKVFKQNVQNKPMLDAFNKYAGRFSGGNKEVSLGVKSGQGGGALEGYSGDDQVSYYNPASNKRVNYAWKEHHIGTVIPHTELKYDGIDLIEDGASQDTRAMDGREEHALANILDEKFDDLGEDYAASLNSLILGDGSSDAKALAGVRSFIFDVPTNGTTGGLQRPVHAWWRNRAATASYGSAGGQGAITVSASNGGALIEFLDKEIRQLNRYVRGTPKFMWFAGSDFIDGYKKELRSNGYYSQSMSTDTGAPDGSMMDPKHAGRMIIYDPTLDDLSLSKRCYVIDMSKTGIRLLYMDGQRMKRHKPARPYDRYTMYNGITMTGVMVARRLNSSAVYDIA